MYVNNLTWLLIYWMHIRSCHRKPHAWRYGPDITRPAWRVRSDPMETVSPFNHCLHILELALCGQSMRISRLKTRCFIETLMKSFYNHNIQLVTYALTCSWGKEPNFFFPVVSHPALLLWCENKKSTMQLFMFPFLPWLPGRPKLYLMLSSQIIPPNSSIQSGSVFSFAKVHCISDFYGNHITFLLKVSGV